MVRPRFCISCGSALEEALVEDRLRLRCSTCGQVHYEHLKVGAGLLLVNDDSIVLVRRAAEPFRDDWCLPSGYAEIDESPSQTASREVNEELGLKVEAMELFGVYFFDDDPRGNGVLIVYCEEWEGRPVTVSGENTEARSFRVDSLPSLAGGGHDKAVMDWVSRREVSER